MSQVLNSLRCVVLPEPSGPSKATSSPRRADASVNRSRARWRRRLMLSLVTAIFAEAANHTLRRADCGLRIYGGLAIVNWRLRIGPAIHSIGNRIPHSALRPPQWLRYTP